MAQTTWGDLTDELAGRPVTFTRDTERRPHIGGDVEDPAASVTATFLARGTIAGVDADGTTRVANVVELDLGDGAGPVARALELRADAPVTVGRQPASK